MTASSGQSRTRRRSPTKIFGQIRLIRHTIALFVLISIADLLLLVALLIKPFSEARSWALACWTGEWFWTYMQKHWEVDLNAEPAVEVSGDELPKGESAFVLCNHLGYSDYYLIQYLSSRAGMLGQSRYFVKKEILRIPLFGLAFWAFDKSDILTLFYGIYLRHDPHLEKLDERPATARVGPIISLHFSLTICKRDYNRGMTDLVCVEDESTDETVDSSLYLLPTPRQAFSRITANAHDSWIILYPEGTRRTPKKLLQSQAFARKNGKPELDHLLFPRTKGFVATVQALKNSHIKHIYDLTLLYSSPGGLETQYAVPNLAEILSCDDLHKRGYGFRIHVRRIPIDTLPQDESGLKAWCEDTWAQKDQLLDGMMNRDLLRN
ncbi:hypothetical protein I317_05218 [Kwoniella heveanensis CBS 569]|nr:hypothetical protein I317_05218 [Kwoniella heveanensis CBS 569]